MTDFRSHQPSWLIRVLIGSLTVLAYGVGQAAGDDLWGFIKTLVQALTG